MTRPRTTCIFCRLPGASEEHVFSKGLAKLLRDDDVHAFVTHTDINPPRSAKIIDLTNRATCVACNTGWMSDFETRALPLLAGPTQGRECELSTTEQIELAAWAFKTTCMLDCSWPGGRVIPDVHFRYLFRFRLPPRNTQIWLTSYRQEEGEILHLARGIRAGRDVTTRARPNRTFGYRVAISIGQLLFYVFGHIGADEQHYDPVLPFGTQPSGVPGKLGDVFHPLWPVQELNLTWPPLIGFGDRALETFMRARAR